MKDDKPKEVDISQLTPKKSAAELLEEAVVKHLGKKQKVTIVDLANATGSTPAAVQDALHSLAGKGYNIELKAGQLELSQTIEKEPVIKLSTEDYFGDDWVRFGAVADTHLASKYCRLDCLNALYDVFEREGVRVVYHAGNWIDGECKFNKYDLICSGFEDQLQFFMLNYPKRKGIETHIISGDDHEGWYLQREKINPGRSMQDRAKQVGREDLIDLGYMERDIEFKRGSGRSVIRIIHAGGGSAYAISYTSQKYVESLQGGEKPALVIMGHFHKFDWAYPREVNVLQPGCTQDQTPFLRKKRIQAMVGGCLVEIKQDKHGVFVRTRVEWMPFFDRKFYEYKWK